MLMSSYVFLNSLYGCGGCDGEKFDKCIADNGGGSGTTAPGRMLEDDYSDISLILAKGGKFAMKQVEEAAARFEAEGRSLSDAKTVCEQMQKQLDCFSGMCDCTCADMHGPDEADIKAKCGETDAEKDMKASDMSKLIAGLSAIMCTGDNAVTDPCA
jgi:hypothetical protein